ncbi:HNH endonuclease [bacterium]|nr:HNH endonuclease [bacterium]
MKSVRKLGLIELNDIDKALSDKEPMKFRMSYLDSTYYDLWVFKGHKYEVKGFYTDDEIRLLILENFDKERIYFEKLNAKFNQNTNEKNSFERPRIPESVRVEVWRRDGGKCARCGSRDRLEYDHIVPISRGGSNTARNIELLCEKCNRSKSNNVV